VPRDRTDVNVDGRILSISNLDKVLYPKVGFTKGQLIDYYARIAAVMLPHLEDRAVTFRRYPDGVDGTSFFEKHAPSHTPPWVRTTRVPRSSGARGGRAKADDEIEYAVIDDRATLLWAANLAAIEFHVPLWAVGDGAENPARPDLLVFDLDPGPGTSIVECCTVAGWLRSCLEAEGLGPVLAKTSGSKGLQLYIPVTDGINWPDERERALRIASAVERDHPDRVVTNMRRVLRQDKVLIDWSQNHPMKTTVGVYSLRAQAEPTASTPVSWDEVEQCATHTDPGRLRFSADDVLRRVEANGDLFAPLLAKP
jgi:bifunctional non-homologous end joining protein LigD